jgi:hypothetical protein
MSNYDELNKQSTEFFMKHWPVDLGEKPTWKRWEPFLSCPIVNYNYGGCYALFEGEHLVYVGVGISKGGSANPKPGISQRLSSHVYRKDNEKDGNWHKLIDQWNALTCIYTIGFPTEFEYLAPALECFLIRKLNPKKNKIV